MHLAAAGRAAARAPAVRRAGRPGDGPAARPGRRARSPSASPLLTVYAYDNDAFSERIEEALLLADRRARVPGALAVAAAAPGRGARAPASATVRRSSCRSTGSDSLAYFALRRDKSYFFSAERPVVPRLSRRRRDGARRRRPDRRRRRAPRAGRASSAGSRTRRAGASRSPARRPRRSPTTRRSGSSRSTSATRPSSGPAEFSLEGRAIRKVRQSVSRLEKSGYEVRVLPTGDADERCAPSCAPSPRSGAATGPSAASRWRWTRCSSTRTRVLAVAVGPDGSVGGFLQLVPSPASDGYSLASMRRRRDTPNGLMEYLITETVVVGARSTP